MDLCDLHKLFWEHADRALMIWKRHGHDLQLIDQNQKAIALTAGMFEAGDLLCTMAPNHLDYNHDLGMPLIDWYLGALDSGVSRSQTFRFDSDNPILDGHWENHCAASPDGKYLRMEFRNVSDQEYERRQLQHQAFTDALTGIPNRQAYEFEIAQRCNDGHPFALIVLDLDGFKQDNDLYGHVFGDELLKAIAIQIKDSVRVHQDFVARTGGDEFAVIVGGDESLEAIAQRLDQRIRDPIEIADKLYIPSASIGIAAYQKGDTPDQIYQYAEECQTRAKKRLKVWQHEQHSDRPCRWWICDRAQSYIHLSKELVYQMALPCGLELNYQPIVDMHTGKAVSYEALIRWKRAGANVPPFTILDIVRQQALDIDFCLWTIQQAQQQWLNWGKPSQRIAINVSPGWLHSEMVLNALIECEGVSCEITEDALLSSPVVMSALQRLRDGGVYCSWDDFGSEYAVFTGLSDLSIDAVKLDIGITRDPKLLQAVVAMFRVLDLGVFLIAEGIETQEQRDYCASVMRFGQGWFWGKAVRGDDVVL